VKRRTRKTLLWVGIPIGTIVVLLAAVKIVIEIRDRADPVDVEEIGARFDAGSQAGGGDSSEWSLETGVWAMRAEGSEFVSIFGGPVHDFPDEVAQSVSNTECGQTLTLDIFEQRSDVLELCRDGDALVLDRFITRHEFVGVKDETVTDDCRSLRVFWADMADDVGEEPTSVDCTADGDQSGVVPAKVTVGVEEVGPVDVAGEPVDAVRINITSEVATPEDPTHGTYSVDLWLGVDTPVILRRGLDADVTADTPIGDLGFEENLDAVVDSIDPISD